MVTIMDYKTYQSEDGRDFHALEVQGGIEVVKSKETGRTYLTVRKATVPCTFDKATCESLKGTQIDGVIRKIKVEPYNYVVPETGEELTLEHRYQFMEDDQGIVNDNLIETEMVA